ncbi:phage portal protein [Tropicimonas sp. IMCC34043]|uniref:phage portal protein n=1 Tax=Tropicimonas sp. IMCC34043 TaxID=2248760 RepID=UPI000E273A46|nr:phage portal protein [Tropicimonas sp. IMCC34043]
MKFPLFWRRRAAAAPRAEPPLASRSFKAAYPSRLVKGFQPFNIATPRADTRREIRGLVSHARHAAQNFDHAAAYEMLIRRHVIGPDGIRLQMDVREDDGRKDKLANARIEKAWNDWGRFGSPTPCGRLSWWDVEKQVATAIAREGGAFIRLHRGRKGGGYGLRVEPIPFDLLDLDLTMRLSGGGWIESGIEFDGDGRPVAYHCWTATFDAASLTTRRRVRHPAADMLHVMASEEIGAALGVPRSKTALRLMNMGEAYREAGLEAAHFGAAAMLFFENVDSSGELVGGDPDGDDDGPPIDKIEAGTIIDLPPGKTAKSHTPAYPEAAAAPFMRLMHQSEAAGLGVSYETLTSDLSGANFSSLRSGKSEERDEWRMLQRAVFQSLHDRVFREWLPAAIAMGKVGLPLVKLDKFLAQTWRPRGWESVNPKDDAAAAETDLRLGLRSRREIIARRGSDFDDVLQELADERDAIEAAGMSAGTSEEAIARVWAPDPPEGKT